MFIDFVLILGCLFNVNILLLYFHYLCKVSGELFYCQPKFNGVLTLNFIIQSTLTRLHRLNVNIKVLLNPISINPSDAVLLLTNPPTHRPNNCGTDRNNSILRTYN